MSKRRCSVCRDYFPAGEMSRVGNVHVCSEACRDEYLGFKNSLPARPPPKRELTPKKKKTNASEIPTGVRNRVMRRDGRRCRWCSGAGRLQVHHITYKSEGIDHSEHNLIVLCAAHHNEGPQSVHANKALYQPACRLVIWMQYVERRYITVPEAVRMMAAAKRRADEALVVR